MNVKIDEFNAVFEIVNDGEYDLKRFYTPDYFRGCGLNTFYEIHIRYETSSNKIIGGYFQEISELTKPYKYFVMMLENNLSATFIDKTDLGKEVTPDLGKEVTPVVEKEITPVVEKEVMPIPSFFHPVELDANGENGNIWEGKEKGDDELEPESDNSEQLSSSDKRKSETIILTFKLSSEDLVNGRFQDIAAPNAYEENIELQKDGLYYDDVKQLVNVDTYLSSTSNRDFDGAYIEDAYRINGRWIVMKRSNLAKGTSVSELDTKMITPLNI